MRIRRSDEHDLTVFPTVPTAPEPPAPAPAATSSLSALEAGTTVHEFRILKLIGEGGFGIVYLAEDQSLDRTVALKEYMPSELAERAGGTSSVQVRSQRYAETFEAGMRSFINEARLLARFDHPSLLKVYRFFQANGTAYMAMPFYEGQALKAILRERTEPPDERWLRRILYQLLDALEIIHRHECYHRDIAPDNVLMLENGTPILLDFGAARRVIGDMTQNLTVILKPGYAPIEQYAEDPDMKQGPWTDIYALASVVHFALTRKPPPASIARAMNDRMEPLAQRLRGQYSDGLLTTIDKALSLKPQDRPQSIAALRAMLLASDDGATDDELPSAPLMGIEALAPAIDTPTGGRGEPSTQPRLATGPRSVARAPEEPTFAAPRAEYAAAAPRNRLPMIGLAAAVPVALGFLWWLTSGSGEPPPAPRAEAPAPKSASGTCSAPKRSPRSRRRNRRRSRSHASNRSPSRRPRRSRPRRASRRSPRRPPSLKRRNRRSKSRASSRRHHRGRRPLRPRKRSSGATPAKWRWAAGRWW